MFHWSAWNFYLVLLGFHDKRKCSLRFRRLVFIAYLVLVGLGTLLLSLTVLDALVFKSSPEQIKTHSKNWLQIPKLLPLVKLKSIVTLVIMLASDVWHKGWGNLENLSKFNFFPPSDLYRITISFFTWNWVPYVILSFKGRLNFHHVIILKIFETVRGTVPRNVPKFSGSSPSPQKIINKKNPCQLKIRKTGQLRTEQIEPLQLAKLKKNLYLLFRFLFLLLHILLRGRDSVKFHGGRTSAS